MTGILLVDKEPDWTSFDAIAKLRGVLRERRMGHSGTLDPMATGLLVVLCGRATRACEFAEADRKEYVAALRPGITTDTQDTTGTILSRSDRLPSEEEFRAVLPRFTGTISQLPPMYSAVKVSGQRLYEIARRGGEVERTPREITIHALELLGREGDDFLLRISCSKGTYIRTLCHDIGQVLGCGAAMSSLRRTKCGPFSVEEAHRISEITPEHLLPLDSLFAGCPALTVTAAQEKRIRCGNELRTDALPGRYRLYAESGEFLSLSESDGATLRTVKSFFEVS